MAAIALRSEEAVGLGVAIAAHLAVVAALLLQPPERAGFPEPERVVVSLTEEVGLTSAAPELAQDEQAAVAPTIADVPAPAPRVEAPPPRVVRTPPPPPPRGRARDPAPRPTVAPPPPRQGGGSRLGEDFLNGAGSSESATLVPASQIGASERASLVQAVARQLRPNWTAPAGLEAEKLSTTVTWRLNEDGSLLGNPVCQQTTGITDSNRPQAGRHCELAIRAIRTTRFDLPPQFYNLWKKLTFTFNKDLSR